MAALPPNEKKTLVLTRTEERIWSLPRYPVPRLLLDAGLDESVWRKTHDGAVLRRQEMAPLMDRQRRLMKWGIPLTILALVLTIAFFFLDVTVEWDGVSQGWKIILDFGVYLILSLVYCRALQKLRDDIQQKTKEWNEFVELQQPHYRAVGITLQTPPSGSSDSITQAAALVGSITITIESFDPEIDFSKGDETATIDLLGADLKPAIITDPDIDLNDGVRENFIQREVIECSA